MDRLPVLQNDRRNVRSVVELVSFSDLQLAFLLSDNERRGAVAAPTLLERIVLTI